MATMARPRCNQRSFALGAWAARWNSSTRNSTPQSFFQIALEGEPEAGPDSSPSMFPQEERPRFSTFGAWIMNLVDTIKNQLSDGSLRQLSSVLGAGESTTRNAAEAAVPALLSGLASMVSGTAGAQKLANALGKFDGGAHANLGRSLTEHPQDLLQQGNGLLNSLMNGNMIGGITDAISRYTGLGTGMVQKLLGMLMPVVLGSVAARFTGKSITPQGLSSMLSDEKASIASAMPRGFSLADVPGMGALQSAAHAGMQAAQKTGSSALNWLVPIGGLAILALVIYVLVRPGRTPTLSIPNEVTAEVTQISTNLTNSITSLNQSLAGIKDVGSATDALPKLNEVSTKLGEMKGLTDKLPEAGKAKIQELVKSNLGKLDDQFAKLMWIPGVADKIKPAVDDVMNKYAAVGGLSVPQVSAVSADLAGTVSTLTSTLTSVKDTATAEAALPKLKEVNEKLEAIKKMLPGLPDAAKSTISSLVKSSIATVQGLATQALAMAGVSDQLKPVVDSILEKLKELAG
jgi:hypothetical protein